MILVPLHSIAKSDIQMGPILEGFVYKAMFDISGSNEKPDQYNRKIESVARFLNMHGRNGVKLENMKLAVVLHGVQPKTF